VYIYNPADPLKDIKYWFVNLSAGAQCLVYAAALTLVTTLAALATHEFTPRPRQTKIILNCSICGVRPEDQWDYNQRTESREQEQKSAEEQALVELRQQLRDQRGRARWCQQHPRAGDCGK
jgi:hypothetical protein